MIQSQKIDYTFDDNKITGIPVVKIEGIKYALGRMVTSNGLKLAHQLQRIMAPLASQAVKGEGKTEKLDMESIILSLSIGLSELTADEFSEFCLFCMGPVTILGSKEDDSSPATKVFEDFFSDKLDHLAILIAHVAVKAGALRFFLGLVSAMNTLSPAQKSE